MTVAAVQGELFGLFKQDGEEWAKRAGWLNSAGIIKSFDDAQPYLDYVEFGDANPEPPRFDIGIIVRERMYYFFTQIVWDYMTDEQRNRWDLLRRLGR